MDRRSFLRGMAGILATGLAPAVVGSGVLMPVRTIWKPGSFLIPPLHVDPAIGEIIGWVEKESQRICGMPPPYVSVIAHNPSEQLLAENMALHINRTLQHIGTPFLSTEFIYEDAKRQLIQQAESILDEVRRDHSN